MSWEESKLEACTSLDELLNTTIEMMGGLKQQGYEIHHVAGAISADGDQYILRNLEELLRQRERVAQKLGASAIVITSPLIFTEEVYSGLGIFDMERQEREACLQQFWDNVIGAGLIDCIHLAPGWERSPGSNKEHEAAKNYGVNISYLSGSMKQV